MRVLFLGLGAVSLVGGACASFEGSGGAPLAVAEAGQDATADVAVGTPEAGVASSPKKLVFLAPSAAWPQDLGRADTSCTALVRTRVDGGEGVAWLAIAGQSPFDRLGTEERTWVLPSGKPVFETRRSIVEGGPSRPINEQLDGGLEPEQNKVVWTGVFADGGVGDTCKDWTALAAYGVVGSLGVMGAAWTANDVVPCNATYKWICFER
jgi:hypothetical protein